MPQIGVPLVVKVQSPLSNLNVRPLASIFVLGVTGQFAQSGNMLHPASGQIFNSVPRLGLPPLAASPP